MSTTIATWVLILHFGTGVSATVPGYETLQECQDALAAFRNTRAQSGYWPGTGWCIPGPRK